MSTHNKPCDPAYFEQSAKNLKADVEYHWSKYLEKRNELQLAKLKEVYAEALQKKKSIEWAEGKAEGLGLPVWERNDVELEELKKQLTDPN